MIQVPLGARAVGDGEAVYVIAEAGSNHNGSLDQAFRLVDAAVDARADAVKFQTFKASRMYPRTAGVSDYLSIPRPIYEIIEEMEMPESWISSLAGYCRKRTIEFLSTPFDEASADLIAPHVSAFKVASYEMTHTPLLRHLARYGRPMIVSTGTATLDEVRQAVEVVVRTGNEHLVLLQCTASYPTPLEAVNLRAMVTLRKETGRLVGLSDHSRDPIIAPVAATALGACVIEKHFTLDSRLPGPDHRFAVEPDELARMVCAIRDAERVLGDGRKEVLPEEQELRAFARRSIFTVRPIRAGEALSEQNVAVLRCGKLGYGLPPAIYEATLGKTATHDLEADHLITLADVQ